MLTTTTHYNAENHNLEKRNTDMLKKALKPVQSISHFTKPTSLRTILISKQAPYLNTQANDSLHNTTRHSYCWFTIYGLPIGRRDCVIYVTCKYMKACCRTQQMACRPFCGGGGGTRSKLSTRTPRTL
jgi:hypothetical protein